MVEYLKSEFKEETVLSPNIDNTYKKETIFTLKDSKIFLYSKDFNVLAKVLNDVIGKLIPNFFKFSAYLKEISSICLKLNLPIP